jgi:hypothetical protein
MNRTFSPVLPHCFLFASPVSPLCFPGIRGNPGRNGRFPRKQRGEIGENPAADRGEGRERALRFSGYCFWQELRILGWGNMKTQVQRVVPLYFGQQPQKRMCDKNMRKLIVVRHQNF